MKFLTKMCGVAAMALSMMGTVASAGTIEDIRARGVLRVPAILNEVPVFQQGPAHQ
jgi:polar amino acid transport system substrate-binding protein